MQHAVAGLEPGQDIMQGTDMRALLLHAVVTARLLLVECAGEGLLACDQRVGGGGNWLRNYLEDVD